MNKLSLIKKIHVYYTLYTYFLFLTFGIFSIIEIQAAINGPFQKMHPQVTGC